MGEAAVQRKRSCRKGAPSFSLQVFCGIGCVKIEKFEKTNWNFLVKYKLTSRIVFVSKVSAAARRELDLGEMSQGVQFL